MSYYQFSNQEYDVTCGYVEHLGHYHLTIYDKDFNDIMFSNLELPCPDMNLAELEALCERFRLIVPKEILNSLKMDERKPLSAEDKNDSKIVRLALDRSGRFII